MAEDRAAGKAVNPTDSHGNKLPSPSARRAATKDEHASKPQQQSQPHAAVTAQGQQENSEEASIVYSTRKNFEAQAGGSSATKLRERALWSNQVNVIAGNEEVLRRADTRSENAARRYTAALDHAKPPASQESKANDNSHGH
jgi:hypothetical protein